MLSKSERKERAQAKAEGEAMDSLHVECLASMVEQTKLPKAFVKKAVTYVNCPSWTILENYGSTPEALREWFLDLSERFVELKRLLPREIANVNGR